ncbi:MAG: DUF6786 family protein [Terriglobia bacterium]|jgi:hypothetical protein
MLARLIKTLEAIGKPTQLHECPDGAKVLILPHGGRILGLFAPRNPENFFWTHPALASPESARAFYESDVWHNSGGDRTWLAPEADIFFPNFPKLDTYWQPRELDPGNYQIDTTPGSLRLVNRLNLTLSRSKQRAELELTKSVAPAPNPLRYERGLYDPATVEYAGYALHTSLQLMGADPDNSPQVGLWNLLQLPHHGDLLVPTYGRAVPKVLMGTVAPDDLVATDHLLRYRMRALGEHKIGIRAVETTGRVGYLYPTNGQFALVIRNFLVNPSGEYVDVPWTDTGDFGYSTQACNVKSSLGSFSELEYHCPAIGAGTGRVRYDDESAVWAFRGPEDKIRAIARSLLSC